MKYTLEIICLLLVTLTLSAQTDTYTYDQIGRLTQVEYSDGTIEDFTYDNVGNRTSYALTLSPLPVELLDFTAYPAPDEKRKSIIEWQTATEIKTNYFEVQHALDGINFNGIGSVNAAGNSDMVLGYELMHHTPEYGINYYRLITHDVDQKKDTSNIATVYFAEDYTMILYPNPTQGITTLQINGDLGPAEEFKIRDMLGRYYDPPITSIGENKWEIDLSGFTPGMYQILFEADKDYQAMNLVVEPAR